MAEKRDIGQPPEREPKRFGSRRSVASTQEAIQKRLSLVDPSRRASVDKRLKQMPVSRRNGYLRAVNGTASAKQAIKAHCLECVGWVGSEVTHCTARACPLYAYRPFSA